MNQPPTGSGPGAPRLRDVWQVPLLVIAGALFIGGVAAAILTRPKPDAAKPLRDAMGLVEREQYEEAIAELNERVLGFIDSGEASTAQVRDFLLTRARAFAGAQARLGIERAENARVIADDLERAEALARELGEELPTADAVRLAEAQLSLERLDDAIKRTRALPADQQTRRIRLTKAIVRRNLDAERPRNDLTLQLLTDLTAIPELTPTDQAWVLARQAELLLDAGNPEDAISQLLRRMPRLAQGAAPGLEGELHVLLARAYFATAQERSAADQLAQADRLLDPGSPLRAEVLLLSGRLMRSRDEEGAPEQARGLFKTVIDEYPSSPTVLPAMLQLAEVEAQLGDHEAAIQLYAELIELRNAPPPAAAAASTPPPTTGESHTDSEHTPETSAADLKAQHSHEPQAGHAPPGGHAPAEHNGTPPAGAGADRRSRGASRLLPEAAITASLLERWRDQFDAGHRQTALRYAVMADGLHGRNDAPSGVLLALAQTHRAIADETMEQARRRAPDDAADLDLRAIDPVLRTEIRHHFLAAGDEFRRHARAAAAIDNESYLHSLWLAGDSYDLGGDLDNAKSSFALYGDGPLTSDPRKPEAKFRLARVLHALGEHASAATIYRELIEAGADAPGADASAAPGAPAGAGLWADRSRVPLAQVLLSDADTGNDPEGEQLLRTVVDGNLVTPEAAEFREGLIELGRWFYTSGRYRDAIERLTEAVTRYPADRRAEVIRFLLADSHRLSAGQIAADLSRRLPRSLEIELQGQRQDRLRTARDLYQQVRSALEGRPPARLTEMERAALRNASFYAPDCAFELGEFDDAIAGYDAARQRYADDPASLVAMVQIVNAYAAQGQFEAARTANQRAREHLARFPDEVWSQPGLPMEKKHWERWLDTRARLTQTASAAN